MALTLFTRRAALPLLTIVGASGAYLAMNRIMVPRTRKHERLALWETARSGGGF
ncbi:hypothetical protein DRE_00737 [Drechslerella stenobrocha 248]|uniref:Uncharacterized protein n=1 Tax=Drechslerella stenobrocha 248 TaxID=1043628 RepID=W7HZF9_9PEZI|nr:hypothetical protein DRE_00737 [Drechslerella stenobrocha 248]